MKFSISINQPTLPAEFYKTKYGWKFIENDDLDENDRAFFSSVNYSFIEWNYGTRLQNNFVAAHGVIIDYDNKNEVITTIPEIREFLDKTLNVKYAIVNSKSHTTERPRYHILFPFDKKVTNPDTYSALILNFMAMLPGEPDGSVYDRARFMGYTPEEKLTEYYCVENQYYIDQLIIPCKAEEKKIVSEHKQRIKDIKKIAKRGHKVIRWICPDELLPLVITEQKHVINCPLEHNAHAHGVDQNKSAFLQYSKDSDNWFIYCSVCSPALNDNKAFWMERDFNFIKKYLLATTKEN